MSPSSDVLEARVHRRVVRVPVIEGTDIRFRRLSAEAGLSQTRVEQIVQGDQGFMWLGTQFGLNRYDGQNFRVFTPNPASTNTISGGYIYSLFKGTSNMIWIGCNQFLDRFNPATETFTHYRLKENDSDSVGVTVLSIVEDSSGTMWLGTGSGLYGLDPNTGQVVHHYTHDPQDLSTLSANEIKSIIVDSNGKLLVADGDDLEQLNQETGKVIWRLLLPGLSKIFNAARSVPIDHESVFHSDVLVWRDSGDWQNGGLALLDRGANTLTYYSFYDQKSGKPLLITVSAMVKDPSGSFWLGGYGGLLKLNAITGTAVLYHHHPDDPESIDEDRVIALERDREGNIWVGLHSREPNMFSTRKPSFTPILRERIARNPQGDHMVSALYEDRGTLWVGASGELIRSDRKTGRDTSYPLNDDILSITGDAAGAIWVGTGYKGLYKIDPQTAHLKRFPLTSSSSAMFHSQILRIVIDHNGAMWLATRNGLQKFDGKTGKFTVFGRDARSRTDEYYDIAEDKTGGLWLGGNTGLQRYDPATGEFKVYQHQLDNPTSLSDNAVSSVLVDHSGNVWAATYNGLAELDTKSDAFKTYYATDGLPSSRVSCVLEDGHGALWLSTARGVSRFDPVAKTFKNYSVADGLPGLDLTGWVTCFKSPTGEMFFGGFSGAVAFFPDNVIDSSYVPPVVFTGFLLSGHSVDVGRDSPLKKSIGYTDRLILSHKENNFSLQFAALGYSSPSLYRYRYRLDAIDNQWNEIAADRFVNYSNLQPGKYTFRVQASTGLGTWNAPGAVLYIEVLPPWWKTWWLRTFYLVLGLVLLSGAYQLRLRRLIRQIEIGVDARVSERTRIARDLHDTLLQSMHGLMFQFQAARHLLPRRPEDAISTLDGAINRTEQAIAESRNAIQDLRGETARQKDLAEQLQAIAQTLAAQNRDNDSAVFRVIVEGDRRTLFPLVQEEVGQIAREILRNAFLHAKAREIEAEIHYDSRLFRLRVRDDGRGVDQSVLEQGGRAGHWGLIGIRERAQRIGAELAFWSEPGAGTEVQLTADARIAYKTAGGGGLRRLRREKPGT